MHLLATRVNILPPMSSSDGSECSMAHDNSDIYVDRAFEVLDHMIMSEIKACIRYVQSPEKFRQELRDRKSDLGELTENCGMARTVGALKHLQALLITKFQKKDATKPATTPAGAGASSDETKDPLE